MKKKVCSLLLFCQIFVIQLNAQIKFAVADYQMIHENIEQHIVTNQPVYIEINALFDSIKMQCIPFIQNEFQWAQKRVDGGCLSLQETQLTENYVIYLRDEMLGMEKDFEAIENLRVQKELLYIKDLSQKLIEERARFEKINFVMENKKVLYQDEEIYDITKEIISEISKVKDQVNLDAIFVEIKPLINKFKKRKKDFLFLNYEDYRVQFPLDASSERESSKDN